MKKNLIVLCILATICLGIFSAQRNQARELRNELHEAKTTFPERSTTAGQQAASNPKSPKIDEVPLSAETVSETVDRLLKLDESDERPETMTGVIHQVGEILESLKDKSGEELFLILDELKNRESETPEAKDAGEILLTLFCDLEPEKSLDFVRNHYSKDSDASQTVAMSAFSAMSKTDPEGAIELFTEWTWKDQGLRDAVQQIILVNLATKDLVAGLEFYETTNSGHPSNRAGIIAQAVQNLERREQAWQLLETENLADDLRDHLGAGILGAISMESGLAATEEALERLKFSDPESRDSALSLPISVTIHRDPEGTMDFISREVSPENQLQKIPRNLKRWADRDFTAAGNWLREQKPSAIKNAAISAYADAVGKLDPQVALEWSSKITDQESRERTERKILETWRSKDVQAAEAWALEHASK